MYDSTLVLPWSLSRLLSFGFYSVVSWFCFSSRSRCCYFGVRCRSSGFFVCPRSYFREEVSAVLLLLLIFFTPCWISFVRVDGCTISSVLTSTVVAPTCCRLLSFQLCGVPNTGPVISLAHLRRGFRIELYSMYGTGGLASVTPASEFLVTSVIRRIWSCGFRTTNFAPYKFSGGGLPSLLLLVSIHQMLWQMFRRFKRGIFTTVAVPECSVVWPRRFSNMTDDSFNYVLCLVLLF